MRTADFEKMPPGDQARLLRDRLVTGTESQGERITVIRFTEEDHFAAEREGFIKQINSYAQRWSHNEFGAYDFRDGLYGEIAFERWSGIARAVAEQGVLTDGGVDFTDNGLTIDVKATAARGTWPVGRAHLLRPRKYHLKADVYVLIVLADERKRARFAGWATRAELETAAIRTKDDTTRPQVYVPTRCIPEMELHRDWRGWIS